MKEINFKSAKDFLNILQTSPELVQYKNSKTTKGQLLQVKL